MSRLPDVYGVCASQYLYDNNTQDGSSPSFASIAQTFKKEGKENVGEFSAEEQRLSQLSLHTISIYSSPTSSGNYTPGDEKKKKRATSTETSPLSLHMTSDTVDSSPPTLSSIDVMLPFSAPQSPLTHESFHNKHGTLSPISDKSSEPAKSKVSIHSDISARRSESSFVPHRQQIDTLESGGSYGNCVVLSLEFNMMNVE